jgi:hypothetical protein
MHIHCNNKHPTLVTVLSNPKYIHYMRVEQASNHTHKWNATGLAEYITALITLLAGKEI